MKRLLLLFTILIGAIFLAETLDMPGFGKYRPRLDIAFIANEYVLSWDRLPYPAYYEIEVLKAPPAENGRTNAAERITKYRTWGNSFTINKNYPFRTYWRVSAHGLFRHPLGSYSECLNPAVLAGQSGEEFQRTKPVATSFYPPDAPASVKPMLTWLPVQGAVYYEVEFLDAPPENPNNVQPSRHRITVSREAFTSGYNADFSRLNLTRLYWRVRALNLDGGPLGVFSDAVELTINPSRTPQLKPHITTVFNVNGMAAPLYPAYSWVPIAGAVNYEVEVLRQPPENPNGATPSEHRIWSKTVTGFACYDDDPRLNPGTYYWRVRGVDADNRTIGRFSDTGSFVVDHRKGNYAATFGDSISHGGGAVSYSPGHWEYSYQTYLTFPVVNLAKSGHTTETMVTSFEQDVLPFRPKYVIILGGTNSLRGGVPAAKVIADLTIIRDK
jgi:hypothetical protein